MSARRKSKRTTRTVRIDPFQCDLEDNELVLIERRGDVRHVVRVRLKGGETWLAMQIARAARRHIQNTRDLLAMYLAWTQKHLDELGGAK